MNPWIERRSCVIPISIHAILLFIAGFVAGEPLSAAEPAPSPAWIRQLGTGGSDESYDVSADGLGNVYITGRTGNDLTGPSAGLSDAYVAKYDPLGTREWVRQFGSTTFDYGFGVAADKLGNVFVAGRTEGVIAAPGLGDEDAFVAKYNALGDQIWVRQFGTSGFERVNDAFADGLGNVYLAGFTNGNLGLPGDQGSAFISKFDTAGNAVWTRRLGTAPREANAVSVDGLGNIYTAGETTSNANAFLTKLDTTGSILWTRQLGTSATDSAYGVSADGLGSIYISGATSGSLGGTNAGGNDVFVSRFDDAGNVIWTRQFGQSTNEASNEVSADKFGNVFVTGSTGGNLFGANPDGASGVDDVIFFNLNPAGGLRCGYQFGQVENDFGLGVSVDNLGSVFVSGWTEANLGGPSAGGIDGFVAKFVVPEPCSATMLTTISSLAYLIRRRRLKPSLKPTASCDGLRRRATPGWPLSAPDVADPAVDVPSAAA
jgi:hypothetical protein